MQGVQKRNWKFKATKRDFLGHNNKKKKKKEKKEDKVVNDVLASDKTPTLGYQMKFMEI